jgi:coenzyme Q-binding protein COQ10
MPYHKDTYKSKHKTSELVNIVADVSAYPEFLPWVAKVRITKKLTDDEFMAETLVKFAAFSQKYTSKVIVERPKNEHTSGHIRVDLVEGPFKNLKTHWHFNPIEPDENGNITQIEFELDFEFKNSFFERVIGTVFEKATIKMTTAFIERCDRMIK